MACSYSDLAMARYDRLAIEPIIHPLVWKRFRDDIFLVWIHELEKLTEFVSYLNTLDPTNKIKFELTMSDYTNSLDFLDLHLSFNRTTKRIETDIYAKPINSFSYVDYNTCYTKQNIKNIHFGTALRLRRICDNNEKFT